jgi:hypothetical protein
MDAIAAALVLAVVHITCRGEEGDDEQLDEDVGALEGIAAYLRNCTPAEEDALAAAADGAATAERACKRPNKKLLHDYEHWMEEMFVEGWEGNRRVPATE